MSSPITSQSNTRAGLCPHGLSPSACPICNPNAMSGGGRMKDSVVTKPKINSGQWSYLKCYAEGIAIKARKVRAENAKNAFERQIEFAKALSKSINNLAQKIHDNILAIQKSLPAVFSSPLNAVVNIFINPLLNIISLIPKFIEKFAQFQQNIRNFIYQAAEKFTAILGEIKNFINRNIFENIKKRAKKLFKLFSVSSEEENYKNDDTLAVFKSRELKKYIVKILKHKQERNKK